MSADRKEKLTAKEKSPTSHGNRPSPEKRKAIFPLRTLRPLRLKFLLFNFHFLAISAVLAIPPSSFVSFVVKGVYIFP